MSVRSALNADQPGQRTPRSVGANEIRQVMDTYDWPEEDYVTGAQRWRVYVHDVLDYMAVWVDKDNYRIAISEDTWATLAYEETAVGQFFADMTGGASGMKFIVADAGPYAVAIRRQAQAEGTAASTSEVDSLSRLEQSANALLQKAASMNRRPTALQQTIFAEQYAGLRADLAALQARLERASAALDLAGAAVADIAV